MRLEPADDACEVVLVLGGEGLDGGHELRPDDEEWAERGWTVGEGEVGGGQIRAVLRTAGERDGWGTGG